MTNEYLDESAFDFRNIDDRGQVLLGFDVLLAEMAEHSIKAEADDMFLASEEHVTAVLQQRVEACVAAGIPLTVDTSPAGLREAVIEAGDDAEESSGFRLRRLDEIRAIRIEFEGTGMVSAELVEEVMVMFRQLALRSAVFMTSEDCPDYKLAAQRTFHYAAAYAALSIADPVSKVWYPFDEHYL